MTAPALVPPGRPPGSAAVASSKPEPQVSYLREILSETTASQQRRVAVRRAPAWSAMRGGLVATDGSGREDRRGSLSRWCRCGSVTAAGCTGRSGPAGGGTPKPVACHRGGNLPAPPVTLAPTVRVIAASRSLLDTGDTEQVLIVGGSGYGPLTCAPGWHGWLITASMRWPRPAAARCWRTAGHWAVCAGRREDRLACSESPAGVAQLAEQPSCKRQVSGSNPLTGSRSEGVKALSDHLPWDESWDECRSSALPSFHA